MDNLDKSRDLKRKGEIFDDLRNVIELSKDIDFYSISSKK